MSRQAARVRPAWMATDRSPARLAGIGIGAVAGVGLAYGIAFWVMQNAFPGDTLTYYLAGLRLNAGHDLYDLRPGDVWLYDRPEYPLFGPPLIGVIWRPLAMLPDAWGMIAWLLAMDFAALLAVSFVLLGTGGWAGLLILPLIPSLTLLIGVGNVDALILLGIIVASILLRDRRDRVAGILIGFLVSIKLTPAVLVVWLIATRRWVALGWTIITCLILAIVAMAGTNPLIWVRYLRVMAEGAGSGRPWALVLLAVGLAAMVALRNHHRAGFILGILLMPLGSPVAAGHSWSLLVATAAPFSAWRGRTPPSAAGSARSPGAGETRVDYEPGTSSARSPIVAPEEEQITAAPS